MLGTSTLCAHCGTPLASSLERCPHCGTRSPWNSSGASSTAVLDILLVVAIIAFFGAIGACFTYGMADPAAASLSLAAMFVLAILIPVILVVKANVVAGRALGDAVTGGVIIVLWVVAALAGLSALFPLLAGNFAAAAVPGLIAAIAAGGIILVQRWRGQRWGHRGDGQGGGD